MTDMDFEFHAGGIEDGILAVLKEGMSGVKTFETYSGQLDNQNLKDAIAAKSPKFPLIMASYADGEDVWTPPTSPVLGRSLHFRHECSFAVICASNDPRGEDIRRRGPLGTYAMMAKVRELLSGLRLFKEVETIVDDEPVVTKHPLTSQVLIPVGNEFVAKMPNITAYAVIFETAFTWSSPDRSAAGNKVTEFVLGVDSLNPPAQNEGNLPGVEFQS